MKHNPATVESCPACKTPILVGPDDESAVCPNPDCWKVLTVERDVDQPGDRWQETITLTVWL